MSNRNAILASVLGMMAAQGLLVRTPDRPDGPFPTGTAKAGEVAVIAKAEAKRQRRAAKRLRDSEGIKP